LKDKKYNLFKILYKEFLSYAEVIVSILPGASGRILRDVFFRFRLSSLGSSPLFSLGIHILGACNIKIGHNFNCGRSCSFYADGNGKISIGDNTSLNSNVNLNASINGELKIGCNVLIGPNVLMRTSDHCFSRTDIPISQQGHNPGKIFIADEVWIGGNVTILGGVVIGKGAVVAAGAVVTSEIAPYAVVGGVPARFIKWRENLPHKSDN
jgi:galactoside O-acetyltransferase